MKITASLLAFGGSLAATGCVSLQALEPVIEPPAHFRGDNAVSVEFLPALEVGLRCAERGAKFLGLPAINAGACADHRLITMLDPCGTVTAGVYARTLCQARELAAAPHTAPAPFRALSLQRVSLSAVGPQQDAEQASADRAVRVEFVHPADVASTCLGRGLSPPADATGLACVGEGLILAANPCAIPNAGWYERALCHELAHANGWPASHAFHAASPAPPLASQSPETLAFLAAQTHDPSGESAR